MGEMGNEISKVLLSVQLSFLHHQSFFHSTIGHEQK